MTDAILADLDGKVVVVTGAARGQGWAETVALARLGATVVACDVAWSNAPARVAADPGVIERRLLDVTDPDGWAELGEWLGREHGVVHGLVNNAGLPWRARLEEIRLEDWNRVLAVNATGPLLGMQTVAPLMTEGGSIVNIGSLASVTGHPAAAYTASKWALRGLSRVASIALGDRGIRSNLVNPGFIATAMTDAAPTSFRVANVRNTPLARAGEADDLVGVVAFLLSDASSFISGAEIAVDGGQAGHAGAKAIFDAEQQALPVN